MLKLLLAVVLTGIPGLASALLIDFEEYSGTGVIAESRVTSQGFAFQSGNSYFPPEVVSDLWIGGPDVASLLPGVVGDRALYIPTFYDGPDKYSMFEMSIDGAGGESLWFSLNSFVSHRNFSDLRVIGVFNDYGDEYFYYADAETMFSRELDNGLREYFLPDTFGSLTSVRFENTAEYEFYVDNIIVNSAFTAPVPVPPAIWLFGSALAGLRWSRRRQIQ